MTLPSRLSRRAALAAGLAAALPFGGATRATAPAPSFPDWPQYRYDAAGTGHNPDATGPGPDVRVRWRHEFSAGLEPLSAPVLADGVLYHAAGDLYALDADDGTRRFRLDGAYRITPAVADVAAYRTPTLVTADRDGAVGVASDGGLALLGGRFGDERWRAAADDGGSTLGGFVGPDEGYPPALADGAAYAATGRGLARIDASSGRVAWTAGEVQRRPAVQDGSVYVVEYPARVRALRTDDGSERWRATAPEWPVGPPAVADGLVFVPDGGGVTAFRTDDGEQEWRTGIDELDRGGAPAVADGTVYVASGERLHALDAATGDPGWTAPYGAESGGPVVAGGTVYVGNGSGLHAVDAATGEHRWSFEPEYGGARPPVVACGLAFTAGHAAVYALEGVDG